MLPLVSQLRFYLYTQPTDMRKSFDGLCGIIVNQGLGNPTSGDVYVFVNRRRNRMKLLVWDKTGFWLFYKRLEKGTFQIPPHPIEQQKIELSAEILLMLIEGIEITHLKRRLRYHQSTSH